MRESMKYNPGYYQLREGQLRRILAIMEQTKTARPGGVVFFGDSLTECYPIERCFPEIENKYNCGIGGAVAEELLWVVDEAVVKYDPRARGAHGGHQRFGQHGHEFAAPEWRATSRM